MCAVLQPYSFDVLLIKLGNFSRVVPFTLVILLLKCPNKWPYPVLLKHFVDQFVLSDEGVCVLDAAVGGVVVSG